MEIPNINIRRLEIPEVPNWLMVPSQSLPFAPPVTVNIGVPIVDIPGCVEAHTTNNPKNNQVKSDDQRGTYTVCDAGIPSYNPINFEPEQIIPTTPAGIDTRRKEPEKPKTPPTPELSIPKSLPVSPVIQCPSSEQLQNEPIGFIFDSGRQRIVGYKLEGTQCVREIESIEIAEQIINAIPPAGAIVTTASIAVVATTSALIAKPFADVLLKVVKPTVKTAIKKINKLRGKPPIILSKSERILDQRSRNHAIMDLRKTFNKK